jgi:hypothetical protein
MNPSQNRPQDDSTNFADRIFKIGPETAAKKGSDRRVFRRHDLEQQSIEVKRVDAGRQDAAILGRIMDISAGGVRIRASKADVRPDHQIRVKLELPDYAGICPFVDTTGEQLTAKREWTGWMTVARVSEVEGDQMDVAGRLVDMDEMDRGMLKLYLSTQPLAA